MNEALNRYYAEQLTYFGESNILKHTAKKPTQLSWEMMIISSKIHTQRAGFLKRLLDEQQSDIEEIRNGLIALFEAQIQALVAANESSSEAEKHSPYDYVNNQLRFYWLAAACVCSLGRDIAVLPVGHLDRSLNTMARRMLRQVINRLKKLPLKTHLDIVDFLESYVYLTEKILMKRLDWISRVRSN